MVSTAPWCRGPLFDPIFCIALQCCTRNGNLDGPTAWADAAGSDGDGVPRQSARRIAVDTDGKTVVVRARALCLYDSDATHRLSMPGDGNGHILPGGSIT